jgi:glycosyltransferase involved in cell wall biosynthesis
MPIALIEAQTLGLPSVVSTAQGNSEVVKHGSTGFVVSNDVEATEKTRLLISDRKLRRTFKLNAIKARDYWSISRVQSEMRDVYNQVTGSGEDAGEK